MKRKDLDKFRSIETFKARIIEDFFINKQTNISLLARKYGPYSTVRRFILEEKKKRDEEDIDEEEYFNTSDFSFLHLGDTYQWSDTTKIWLVKSISTKESEEVFVLVPSKKKGNKHFICTEEQ